MLQVNDTGDKKVSEPNVLSFIFISGHFYK